LFWVNLMLSVPRLVPHLAGERIEVGGSWLSLVAVGEQTGGAYALIETSNNPSAGVRLHVSAVAGCHTGRIGHDYGELRAAVGSFRPEWCN
jgi:hypothetical protein